MIRFYHDPISNTEISTASPPEPTWILISEIKAGELSAARKAGARIYVNGNRVPMPFAAPEKPQLRWNETAHLMPFVVIEGEPTQLWAVTKLSIEEQSELLAALRWSKQNGGRIFRNSNNVWETTTDPAVAGDIYIPTDALTMTTLMGIKGDYDNGIDVLHDWKVSSFTFVSLSNAELAAAYQEGQRYWQLQFTIERTYAEAIAAGRNVNIYEWTL